MKFLISILSFIGVVAVCAGSDSFWLTGEKGEQLGPFEFKEQSNLKIGNKKFTLSKVTTEKKRTEEILSNTILPELDLANEGLQRTVDLMNQILFPDQMASSSGLEGRVLIRVDLMESARSKTCRKDLAKQKNLTIKEALQLIAKEFGTKWLIHRNRVHISSINDPDGPLIVRSYEVHSMDNLIGAPSSSEIDEKGFFSAFGVPWPDGSSARYTGALDTLIVKNTEENLDMIENVLKEFDAGPSQVEVEIQFVEYDRSDISTISTGGVVNVESLAALRAQGKGKLLYAPKVAAKPGTEATVKGVSEYIYPTQFYADTLPLSNLVSVVSNAAVNLTIEEQVTSVTPGNFETREVGVILSMTANLNGWDTIDVTLAPEIVYEPVWKDYSFTYSDRTGKEHKGRAEQPFFHSQKCVTSVLVKNGETVLVGGGMAGRDNGKLMYAFMTARLIDMKGKPVDRKPVVVSPNP